MEKKEYIERGAMTDNDIIKALECCVHQNCAECQLNKLAFCMDALGSQALDLINRQKAEIERLQHICAELSKEDEKMVERGEKMCWIPAAVKLPEEDECEYLVIVNGEYTNDEYANGPYATQRFERAVEIALYSEEEGWILEAYPDWDEPVITHWMPLPEPPEVDHDLN